ncbi:MAG: hypothetical protein ABJA37_07970 [Ferruginibacter sp.]
MKLKLKMLMLSSLFFLTVNFYVSSKENTFLCKMNCPVKCTETKINSIQTGQKVGGTAEVYSSVLLPGDWIYYY